MIPSPKHHWCLQTLPPGRVAFAFVWCNVRPTYSTNKIFIFIYILWKQMEAKLNSSSPRRKRHLFSCSCFSVHGYESQSTFWPPLDHSSVFIRHYPWSLQCASMGWQENLENRPSREENALPFWSPSLYSKKKKNAPFSVVNFPRVCDHIYNGHYQKYTRESNQALDIAISTMWANTTISSISTSWNVRGQMFLGLIRMGSDEEITGKVVL